MSTNQTPQPDSPEVKKILADFGGEVLKDQMTTTRRIDKALAKLEEYYTNKFLEALPKRRPLNQRISTGGRTVDIMHASGYNQAIDDTTTAIKKLNKAQLAKEEEE